MPFTLEEYYGLAGCTMKENLKCFILWLQNLTICVCVSCDLKVRVTGRRKLFIEAKKYT